MSLLECPRCTTEIVVVGEGEMTLRESTPEELIVPVVWWECPNCGYECVAQEGLTVDEQNKLMSIGENQRQNGQQ